MSFSAPARAGAISSCAAALVFCAHTSRYRRAPAHRRQCRARQEAPRRRTRRPRASNCPIAPAWRKRPLPAPAPSPAAAAPLTFHSSSTNSSPPKRATTSEARTLRRIAAATALSIASPARMAMAIVDRLEAVEIEINQRGAGTVALDVSERTLEFALEAAAIERLGQRIDVDPRLEIQDAGAGLLKLRRQRSTSAASRMTRRARRRPRGLRRFAGPLVGTRAERFRLRPP